MDALEVMLSRNSVPAGLLCEPAPDDAELEIILETAMRAPDHGAVRPWRFIVFRGEARRQLGEVFVRALEARDPSATPEARKIESQRPLRSPLVIALYADVVENHPKVPIVEQIVSCGAAAQNVLNAAHAKGYAGIMLTGINAYDPIVKAALGVAPKDHVIGFIYLGTAGEGARPKARPRAADYIRVWPDARTADAAAE